MSANELADELARLKGLGDDADANDVVAANAAAARKIASGAVPASRFAKVDAEAFGRKDAAKAPVIDVPARKVGVAPHSLLIACRCGAPMRGGACQRGHRLEEDWAKFDAERATHQVTLKRGHAGQIAAALWDESDSTGGEPHPSYDFWSRVSHAGPSGQEVTVKLKPSTIGHASDALGNYLDPFGDEQEQMRMAPEAFEALQRLASAKRLAEGAKLEEMWGPAAWAASALARRERASGRVASESAGRGYAAGADIGSIRRSVHGQVRGLRPGSAARFRGPEGNISVSRVGAPGPLRGYTVEGGGEHADPDLRRGARDVLGPGNAAQEVAERLHNSWQAEAQHTGRLAGRARALPEGGSLRVQALQGQGGTVSRVGGQFVAEHDAPDAGPSVHASAADAVAAVKQMSRERGGTFLASAHVDPVARAEGMQSPGTKSLARRHAGRKLRDQEAAELLKSKAERFDPYQDMGTEALAQITPPGVVAGGVFNPEHLHSLAQHAHLVHQALVGLGAHAAVAAPHLAAVAPHVHAVTHVMQARERQERAGLRLAEASGDTVAVTAARARLAAVRRRLEELDAHMERTRGQGYRRAAAPPSPGGAVLLCDCGAPARGAVCQRGHRLQEARPLTQAERAERSIAGKASAAKRRARAQQKPMANPGVMSRLRREWGKLDFDLLPFVGDEEHPEARKIEDRQVEIARQMSAARNGMASPGSGVRDLVVVGGGPAGLNAAINGGAEGLDTLMIEKHPEPEAGGQARLSSRIENYGGFVAGTTGRQLVRKLVRQAKRQRANMRFGTTVEKMEYDPDSQIKTLYLSDGSKVKARSVIIAGGAEFKKLGVPGENGPGVVYGDSSYLHEPTAGKDVVLVGAANSSAQAALDLARTARRVTILGHGPLSKRTSDYLLPQMGAAGNVRTKVGDVSEIVRGEDGNVKAVRLKDLDGNDIGEIPAAGVGVFIGARPSADWADVERGDDGGVKTNLNPDSPLETSIPGVFAAGDVRSHVKRRVQGAAGDASVAVGYASDYTSAMKNREMQEGKADRVPEKGAKSGKKSPTQEAWDAIDEYAELYPYADVDEDYPRQGSDDAA
jgi:thioredoxin reductase